MVEVRVVVIGDSRRAPAFTVRLAHVPAAGQLLDLPPHGGVVQVIAVIRQDFDESFVALAAACRSAAAAV
jgi:hypothetical protein